jgi:ABC-type anion transport system duplicated permease subunit
MALIELVLELLLLSSTHPRIALAITIALITAFAVACLVS